MMSTFRYPLIPAVCLTAAFCVPNSLSVLLADETAWTYVSNESAPEFPTQMRRLELLETPPEDAVVEFSVPAEAQFGQLRYGSFDSRRVTIMLAESADGTAIWVDGNRDRRLTESERLPKAESEWTMSLPAEFVDGDSLQADQRQVRLRYIRQTLTVGTVGFVQGQTEIDGQIIAVRRVDANGNGQFADAADQVWLDRNQDGRWDVFGERFLFQPIMRLNGNVLKCAADVRGHRYSISRVDETGRLQLQVVEELRQRGLVKLSVVMAGRAGSIVHLDLQKGGVEVPVDDYRPVNLIATFEQADAPTVWTFEFVRAGSDEASEWTTVKSTATAMIDPLRDLAFDCKVNRDDLIYTAGTKVEIQPTLVTGSGLRIQSGYFGYVPSASAGEPKAVLTVAASDIDRLIEKKVCGFT
ncbi:MAG: hypothetical protein R3C59_05575 [Planctomycetaceae bacterium]